MNNNKNPLDTEPECVEKENPKSKSPVEKISPFAGTVSGDEILNEMVKLLNKYVYLPDGISTALACWCLGSYCFESWQLYPKLLITSPEKRCGKSTLLEAIETIAFQCFLVSNTSASSIFRLIDEYTLTLVIDEADTFVKENEELNGLINAGHKKRLAKVLRTERDGNQFKATAFSVWCPMVIAGIGSQKDTLHDRSIHIEMERKLPDCVLDKMPFNLFEKNTLLRSKAMRWSQDNKTVLRTLSDIPNHGNDRAQDNWQPLVTIASLAGGDWLKNLLATYKHAMLSEMPEENASVLLLRDIQAIMTEGNHSRITSSLLVEQLNSLEESPWCTWRRGQPMTANSLSRLLKPFKIKPKQIRFKDKNNRGFDAKQFENSFSRYIPLSQSATPLQTICDAGSKRFQSATRKNDVVLAKPLEPSRDMGCSTVAVETGGREGGSQKVDGEIRL